MDFRKRNKRDDDSISSVDSVEVQAGEYENGVGNEEETEENSVTDLVTPSSTLKEYAYPVSGQNGLLFFREEFILDGRGAEYRRKSRPFLWKGVEWTILLIFKSDGIGLFFGYDDPTSLPSDFVANVSFIFHIAGVTDPSAVIQYKFQRPKQPKPEREDFGRFGLFPLRVIPGNRIKVTMKLREHFTPKRAPFNYDSKASTGMVGLENLGATCYLNSLLQMLFHLNSFRRAVYQIPHKGEDYKTSTTLALQNVFHNLQTSNKEVTTKDLTTAFGWTSVDAFMQQDVQEMMRILIDKLEDKMKGTGVDGYAKELFCGKIKSFIRCINVDYESAREEEFYDIQLDVKGCKTLYDSFNKYIETEVLNEDNQYDSGKYGKQDAKKGVIFTKLPPVLTVQLKRFDFDLNTLGFKKIHDALEFPLQLQLDNYLLNESEESEAGKDGEEGNDAKPKNNYLLHSVLVHSGDVGGGHYYAFIRPANQHNYETVYSKNPKTTSSQLTQVDLEWFKFNDETVLQVSKFEAVDHCFGRRAARPLRREAAEEDDLFEMDSIVNLMSSAYMLVYVRESDAPTIMKPIQEDDVPSSLIQRLQRENLLRKAQQRRQQRTKWFPSYSFATEKEIANFNSSGRFNTFIDESSMIRKTIMADSRLCGLFLDIARHVNVPPTRIRLWNIEKKYKMFNIGEVVQFEDLIKETFDREQSKYFVEIIENLEEIKSSEEEEERFVEMYNRILQEEKEWLMKLRTALLESDPDLALLEQQSDDQNEENDDDERTPPSLGDLTYGCGIGKSNKPLDDLKRVNLEKYNELNLEIHKLQNELMRAVEEFGAYDKHITQDSVLIFFKLYDPNDLIALPSSPFQHHNGATSKRIEELKDMKGEIDADELPFDDASFSLKRIRQQVNPMKYIGFVRLKLTDSIFHLQTSFHPCLQKRGLSQEGNELFSNPQSYAYFAVETAIKMEVVDFKEDELINQYFYEGGGLCIATLSEVALSQLHIDLSKVSIHPIDHYRARYNTKIFEIHPLNNRDRKVLYHLKKMQQFDKPNPPSSSSSRLSSPDRGDGSSDSIIGRKRALQTTNDDKILNSPTKATPAESNHCNIISELEVDFNLLEVTVADLLKSISLELQLDPAHILIYFNPQHDACRDVSSILPLSAVDPSRRIIEYLQQNVDVASVRGNNSPPRYQNQVVNLADGPHNWMKESRFLFYYRITPFELVISNSLSVEAKPAEYIYRDFEVLITDERLRYLRKLWIDHKVKDAAPTAKAAWKELFFEFDSHPYNSQNHPFENQSGQASKRLKVASTDSLSEAANETKDETTMDVEGSTANGSAENNQQHNHKTHNQHKEAHEEWLKKWFNYSEEFKRFFQDQSQKHDSLNYSNHSYFHPKYDIPEYHKLRIRVMNNLTVGNIMSKLQNEYLGIPSNYDVLYHEFQEKYESQLRPSAFASPTNQTTPTLTVEQEKREVASFAENYLLAKSGLDQQSNSFVEFVQKKCSSEISFITEVSNRGQKSKKRKSEKIEDESTDEEEEKMDVAKRDAIPRLSPAMPLLLTWICGNRIVDSFTAAVQSQQFPRPWFTAESPSSEPEFELGLQSVTLEDLSWFSRNHQIDSRMVSVFNFTLIGNTVQICDSKLFSGPFVTYIREDDTYWTFLQRCAMITGEKELHTTRLAVVDANTPHFVVKPDLPLPTVNHEGEAVTEEAVRTNSTPKNAQQQQQQHQSLWELAMKYYPMEAMSRDYLENQNQENGLNQKFMFIGIQRSSAEVKALTAGSM